MKKATNQYSQLIELIFKKHFRKGITEFVFEREELEKFAQQLKIRNLGDAIYTFRYRQGLPASITSTAGKGQSWLIRPAGKSKYKFVLSDAATHIVPNLQLIQIKIPDSTPGLIAKHALNDEQALLAKLRYNRLVDIFTQLACYSLQNHLRTAVKSMGQIETDEVYVAVGRNGSQYVIPLQAKGGRDKISVIQIEQDLEMCRARFPSLVCRPLAAQFLPDEGIAIFEFQETPKGIKIVSEKHYRLVSPAELSDAELKSYQQLSDQ